MHERGAYPWERGFSPRSTSFGDRIRKLRGRQQSMQRSSSLQLQLTSRARDSLRQERVQNAQWCNHGEGSQNPSTPKWGRLDSFASTGTREARSANAPWLTAQDRAERLHSFALILRPAAPSPTLFPLRRLCQSLPTKMNSLHPARLPSSDAVRKMSCPRSRDPGLIAKAKADKRLQRYPWHDHPLRGPRKP